MKTKRGILSTALLLPLLLTLFPILPGQAQPAIGLSEGRNLPAAMAQGDDFLISHAEGTLRGAPAAAYNDDLDEYLVVWVDSRGNDAYWDIYGQILTSGGIPQGGNFVIRDEAAGILTYPDVAYDTVNQRYLVAWYDITEVDVEGQLLNSDGTAFGAAFNIAEGTPGDVRAFPAVAFHPQEGEYLVVYQGGAAGDLNVYAKRVDATGNVGGTEYQICTETGDQTDPDVSVDPSAGGDFLIVWEDGRTATDQIYGNILYATTWFLGSEFVVAAPADALYNPTAAFNPDAGTAGEWLVTYQRDVGGDSQIRGRRVAADGTPTGTGITICDDSGDQQYPDVAYSAYGSQWLVVWEDHRAGVNNYDIYGRRVDVNADPLGDTFGISSAPDSQLAPAVASSSSSAGYLVAFPDGQTTDISGQRVLSSGGLMGHLFNISTPLNRQMLPAVAYNTTDAEYLVAWQDERAGDWDIYGQRLGSDGAALGGTFIICEATGDQLLPDVAYNLDTNQYLVVWEDRRADADIYGQRVNADGSLDGSEVPIAGLSATARRRPRVAFNPISGEYLVVYLYEEENNNIRGRRVPPGGDPTTPEIDIATGDADQNFADVACRSVEPGGGGYLVVWRETVDTQRDIRGERLNQDGSLLGSLDICTEASSQWSPRVAYSPENDRYLVVWPDDRDNTTQGRNIYGRQVGGAGALYDEFAISTANDNQAPVAVTWGGGPHNYIVVWEDTRNAGTTPDLYGQRVSGLGALVDTEASNNDLLYTGLGEQESPAVAWGGSTTQGLLAWQDARAGTSDYDVYGLRLEAEAVVYNIFIPLVAR
jgi:hypothetical protein